MVTAGILSFLPILQFIPGLWIPGHTSKSIETYQKNPPTMIDPIPQKPKEKPTLEKPKIAKPLLGPTLTEIEVRFMAETG
jgi:hypothetical protein